MTKPECSKTEMLQNDVQDSSQISENKPTQTSAKKFVTDFCPESSDSDDEELIISQEDEEPPSKKTKENKKQYRKKYRKEWESKPELKSWLSESIHGDTYFYCKICKKDYRCGISDIHKHMSSKKHTLKAAAPEFRAQKFKFRGLLCPVFTPFVPANKQFAEVNYKVIPKYASFLAACGIKGILINDVNGEGMSLTIRERIDLIDTWVETCKKTNQFLMVQIGGACIKDVVEMAKHANHKEVGAVVLLPDVYHKPKSRLDLIRYIKFVSEYTKNTPILLHHHPELTQIDIDVSALLLDITGEIDTFVGVIYSTNDIQKSTLALAVNRELFTVFMGTDEGILGAVASGFSCIMARSLNFLPKVVESICQSIKSGDVKKAQASQNLLNRALDVVGNEGDSIAAFKAATYVITKTCGPTTREPIETLWEGKIKKMQAALHELGVM